MSYGLKHKFAGALKEAGWAPPWLKDKVVGWEQNQEDKHFQETELAPLWEAAGLTGTVDTFSKHKAKESPDFLNFVQQTDLDKWHGNVSDQLRTAWMYGAFMLWRSSKKRLEKVLREQLSHDTRTKEILQHEDLQASVELVHNDLLSLAKENPQLLMDLAKNLQVCAELGDRVRKEEDELDTLLTQRVKEKESILDSYAGLSKKYNKATEVGKREVPQWNVWQQMQGYLGRRKQQKIEKQGQEGLKSMAAAEFSPEEVSELLGIESGLHLNAKEFLAKAAAEHTQVSAKAERAQQLDVSDEEMEQLRDRYQNAYQRISQQFHSITKLQAEAVRITLESWVEQLQRDTLTAAEAAKIRDQMEFLDPMLSRKGAHGQALRTHGEVARTIRGMHDTGENIPDTGAYISEKERVQVWEAVEKKVHQKIAEDIMRVLSEPVPNGTTAENRKKYLTNYLRQNVLFSQAFPNLNEAAAFLHKVLEGLKESGASVKRTDARGAEVQVLVWELDGQNQWLDDWTSLMQRTVEPGEGGAAAIEKYAQMDTNWMDDYIAARQPRTTVTPRPAAPRPAPTPTTPLDVAPPPEQQLQQEVAEMGDKERERLELQFETLNFNLNEFLKESALDEEGEIVADAVDSTYRTTCLKNIMAECFSLNQGNPEHVEQFLYEIPEGDIALMDTQLNAVSERFPNYALSSRLGKKYQLDNVKELHEVVQHVMSERGIPPLSRQESTGPTTKQETVPVVEPNKAVEEREEDEGIAKPVSARFFIPRSSSSYKGRWAEEGRLGESSKAYSPQTAPKETFKWANEPLFKKKAKRGKVKNTGKANKK